MMPDSPPTAPSRGARFYRCALQVNPFAYVKRHSRATAFADEDSYNQALVIALRTSGVEVICVTDHYRIKDSLALCSLARENGIHAFHGFEAVSKDGVHFLCIFEDSVSAEKLERIIGECGVRDETSPSPNGSLDAITMLERAPQWNAVLIAAHASSKGGVLATLSGQARINVWTHEQLLACSLPGPADGAIQDHHDIIANRDAAHKRAKPIAVINAQDLDQPTDAAASSKSCLIKMTAPSVEALRQSFLDDESRIRLNSDPMPAVAYEIASIAWEGGFLSGVTLGLSPHLNCLIGGRGTGKSTAIESIRALFDLAPLGTEARKRHELVVKNVIRPGTKVTAEVVVYKPIETRYSVELIVPGDPVVRASDGSRSQIQASDLIPGLEVYGQHEISELANDPRALTGVLERFLESSDSDESVVRNIRRDLDASRSTISSLDRRVIDLAERVSALPRLEEQLKRFEDAGFSTHLKEQTAVINEAAELEEAAALLHPLSNLHEQLTEILPLELAGLAFPALGDSPLAADIAVLQDALSTLSSSGGVAASALEDALATASSAISDVRTRHTERRLEVDRRTQALLRSLGAGSTDGQEYLRTKSRIKELLPQRADLQKLNEQLEVARKRRQELLAQLEDARAKQFRALEKAAKRVTRKLGDAARVTVTYHGERTPLTELLKRVGGRLAEAIAALERHDALTPLSLAARVREGASALKATYQIPPAAAERLAQMDSDLQMELEQLELEHTTGIELNIAPAGSEQIWKHLGDLSSGQKATAVLLLLLLESNAPLVIDQPEDDLDNRFIFDTIVPRMREEKHRRQLVFATHNANIPVLGDAELIAGFHAEGDTGTVAQEHVGALDKPTVKGLVEQVLEGGREAFERRRRKYQF